MQQKVDCCAHKEDEMNSMSPKNQQDPHPVWTKTYSGSGYYEQTLGQPLNVHMIQKKRTSSSMRFYVHEPHEVVFKRKIIRG